MSKRFCTLGMFIIDEFEFRDLHGKPLESQTRPPQIGGGGTYAAIGARIFLEASQIGMVVDKGSDFPPDILQILLSYGQGMWLFRNREIGTTRALNKYTGEFRGFEYLTPRIRITPKDLEEFPEVSRPSQLHFICSPARAGNIIDEIKAIDGWKPVTIYEPIPDRCIPQELPSLIKILPEIDVLSPNAEEALSLLGKSEAPPTRESIQWACAQFLELGANAGGAGCVIIRSGALGAYMGKLGEDGLWIDAFWQDRDQGKVVDVTGAGNAFLGGLSAGLSLTDGNMEEAVFYASVAASFVIEQFGLPRLDPTTGTWNCDEPMRRVRALKHSMQLKRDKICLTPSDTKTHIHK
ncbi:Ribokinase-like protein [Gautieria morchelliformis]|nr:Ribokinase-like protein [Gautieria morchelliformis]